MIVFNAVKLIYDLKEMIDHFSHTKISIGIIHLLFIYTNNYTYEINFIVCKHFYSQRVFPNVT